MIGQQPRFALEEPLFPFPALAAAAGRATLGGPREITLACLMAARMAALLLKPFDTPSEAHRERADKARHWVGTLSLPAAIRNAALKAVEATGTGDVDLTGAALDRLLAVAAATLDPASRDELSRLAERLSRAAEIFAATVAGPAAAQNELQPG